MDSRVHSDSVDNRDSVGVTYRSLELCRPSKYSVLKNRSNFKLKERGAYIDVPVDSTMSELLFELYCPQLTKLQIFNPRYRSQRDIQTLVQTGNNYLYSIKNVEPGNWQAVVECKTDFYIEIRGQSPVDFFFTFASSDNNFKPTSPFGLNPRTVSSQIANDDDKKYLLVHSLGVENVELQSVQFKQVIHKIKNLMKELVISFLCFFIIFIKFLGGCPL